VRVQPAGQVRAGRHDAGRVDVAVHVSYPASPNDHGLFDAVNFIHHHVVKVRQHDVQATLVTL
jgi:hypothetical protein